ncbi:extracellular solute-binding protein [Streptomyces sp. H39-S7]|uniref:extracellular solute-binding protein n=1 Tax=Streptomyces sp. H39-S7 TaxID=3004357 RepID=UPI0022AEA6E3|nr:extracellular solute-binding protein [Streptomyces sp. H39-S7]MCZ4120908.1 extracellular solute-binding protein [Streptomyces sp. H39-S7]
MSSSSYSRRTVLRSIAAGGAALAVPSVLTACSSSSGGHDVSNAGKKLAAWPAHLPFQGPVPDLPGTANGVQAGFTSYPKNLVRAVAAKPGDGSTIKVLTITYGTPPKAAGQNKFWTAVNEALGVTIEYTVVPDSDYPNKMATLMAGDDLPDIINIGGGYVLPREAEFVQSKCADLSELLSGDAVKQYPNLANIPTYAWQDMGRIGGRIFGVPVERSKPGNTLWVNRNVFDGAGMKDGWTAEDFLAVATAATSGRKYALGASQQSVFGVNVHALAFGAPYEWKVAGGAFSDAYATPEFRAAIEYMAKLRAAGVYEPNASATSQVDLKSQFYNGTVASMTDGFGALISNIQGIKGKFDLDAALPYSSGGAKPAIQQARNIFGYTVLKKASKDRLQLMLRVLDYLASPFGSKEYELLHYGIEGTHFSRGADGAPKLNELGLLEGNTNLPFKYLCDAPQVLFIPGQPEAVRTNHAWQVKAVPLMVRNPRFGLQSATLSRVGANVDQYLRDSVMSIVAGRKPVGEWDAVVKKARNDGRARMADELAKDYAANT